MIRTWAVAVALASSGCVGKQKYDAALAEIDGLKSGISELEEQVSDQDAELRRLRWGDAASGSPTFALPSR